MVFTGGLTRNPDDIDEMMMSGVHRSEASPNDLNDGSTSTSRTCPNGWNIFIKKERGTKIERTKYMVEQIHASLVELMQARNEDEARRRMVERRALRRKTWIRSNGAQVRLGEGSCIIPPYGICTQARPLLVAPHILICLSSPSSSSPVAPFPLSMSLSLSACLNFSPTTPRFVAAHDGLGRIVAARGLLPGDVPWAGNPRRPVLRFRAIGNTPGSQQSRSHCHPGQPHCGSPTLWPRLPQHPARQPHRQQPGIKRSGQRFRLVSHIQDLISETSPAPRTRGGGGSPCSDGWRP